MANTLKLGAGKWATGTDTVLAFNDENNNFKPLPFDFSRASSATVVNQSGLIETVGVGEPRIDFKDNTKGALLLEPQRTNLINQSQTFIGGWSKLNGAVVSGEKVTSPDGTLNASQLVFNGTTGGRIERGITNLTQGADYTVSVYARVSSGTQVVRFGSVADFEYTLTTEWQRLTSTQPENDTIAYPRFRCDDAATIEIYAFQLEQGSYATSYIPTSGSAVTRVGEVSKIVNSPILQATNQFTLFFDAKDFVNYGATFANIMITLGAGESPYDAGTGIHIYNKIWYYFNGSSAVTLGICYNATTDSKFAISYDGTKYTRYANGVKLGTNTVSASMSNWDTITNGSLSYTGVDRVFDVADLKLYNTALTDAEAIALTTI